MTRIAKLVEKLARESVTLPELESVLGHFGFEKFHGKGSHAVWGCKQYSDVHIVIATHTKEVPRYQLRQIFRSLKKRGII